MAEPVIVWKYNSGSEGSPTWTTFTGAKTIYFTATATNTNIFAVQFDTNPTSTAPILTAWDSSAHSTTAKEILDGTTTVPAGNSLLRANLTSSNVLPASGAGTLAAGFKSQTSSTTTYQLKGDTYKQTASSAIDAGKQIRFALTCFIPDDIGAGTTEHDPVITVKYTFV